MIESYPLQWPIGWPREDQPQFSRFKTGLVDARKKLVKEVGLLGGTNFIISSKPGSTPTGRSQPGNRGSPTRVSLPISP